MVDLLASALSLELTDVLRAVERKRCERKPTGSNRGWWTASERPDRFRCGAAVPL